MKKFPENIDKVLNAISKEYKITLRKETHYDSINRVLSWLEKHIQKRLDFTLIDRCVSVTLYNDKLPFCPKLLLWFDKNIPELRIYPSFVKIAWESLGKLSLEESEDFYKEKIQSYIEYAQGKKETRGTS